MQLTNALTGGQIYADVETQMHGAGVHSQKRGGTTHAVHIGPNTFLSSILKADIV